MGTLSYVEFVLFPEAMFTRPLLAHRCCDELYPQVALTEAKDGMGTLWYVEFVLFFIPAYCQST
jgi:hypothetical protein